MLRDSDIDEDLPGACTSNWLDKPKLIIKAYIN